MRVKRRKTGKGFSLVEVLIALVILAVGILVIAQMQAAAIDGLTFSRHMSTATQLGQQHLEYLRSLPFHESDATVCPTVDGAALRDGGGRCVLFDDVDGDGNPGPFLYYQNPRNELGQEVPPNAPGMKYYLRWRVERGGVSGTPGPGGGIGIPGAGQMAITVQVIWWEKQPATIPDLTTLSATGLRTSKGRMVEFRSLRQQDF